MSTREERREEEDNRWGGQNRRDWGICESDENEEDQKGITERKNTEGGRVRRGEWTFDVSENENRIRAKIGDKEKFSGSIQNGTVRMRLALSKCVRSYRK